MKLRLFRRFFLSCLFLSGSISTLATPLAANEWALNEYAERLAAVETELANVRTNLGGDTGGCGGDSCGYERCCRSIYGGFEVPYLRVYNAGLAIPGVGFNTPEFDYQPGIRMWGGTQREDGLGGRITYFDFEDAAGSAVAGVPLGAAIDIYAFDFEVTQTGSFCSWDYLVSGGIRVAGLEETLAAGVLGGISVLRDFDGGGLTMAFGFDRQLGDTNLSMYGNFRGSLLFGDADVTGTALGAPFVAQIPNESVSVLEMQMGVEYRRDYDWGVAFVRSGLEAQQWESPPILLGIGDSNIGLFGPTFALGFER